MLELLKRMGNVDGLPKLVHCVKFMHVHVQCTADLNICICTYCLYFIVLIVLVHVHTLMYTDVL